MKVTSRLLAIVDLVGQCHENGIVERVLGGELVELGEVSLLPVPPCPGAVCATVVIRFAATLDDGRDSRADPVGNLLDGAALVLDCIVEEGSGGLRLGAACLDHVGCHGQKMSQVRLAVGFSCLAGVLLDRHFHGLAEHRSRHPRGILLRHLSPVLQGPPLQRDYDKWVCPCEGVPPPGFTGRSWTT